MYAGIGDILRCGRMPMASTNGQVAFGGKQFGSPNWIRTNDLPVNNRLLRPLFLWTRSNVQLKHGQVFVHVSI